MREKLNDKKEVLKWGDVQHVDIMDLMVLSVLIVGIVPLVILSFGFYYLFKNINIFCYIQQQHYVGMAEFR